MSLFIVQGKTEMQEISETRKSAEFNLMNKQISDVECKGRMPTGRRCGKILYQSDGEYLLILGLVLNPEQTLQKIVCDNCGYKMIWKRNRRLI